MLEMAPSVPFFRGLWELALQAIYCSARSIAGKASSGRASSREQCQFLHIQGIQFVQFTRHANEVPQRAMHVPWRHNDSS